MNNTYSYILAAFAGALILFLLLRGCEKEQPENPKLPEIREGQAKAANIDSIVTATEARVQAHYDSIIAAREQEANALQTAYDSLKATDRSTTVIYRDNPTLEDCDHALAAKDALNLNLEHRLINCILGNAARDSVIRSNKRVIAAKDTANMLLNKSLATCVEELEKPQPKPKRWVISGGAGYGAGNTGLTPFVGVTVGYKILEF